MSIVVIAAAVRESGSPPQVNNRQQIELKI